MFDCILPSSVAPSVETTPDTFTSPFTGVESGICQHAVSGHDLDISVLPDGTTTVTMDATVDTFVEGELDLNKDGVVNWADRKLLTSLYGASVTGANYSARADFNLDGTINASDLRGYAPPWLSVACLADFNASGAVSVQDLFDFQSAWFARNPAADINASGSVTVQDLFDFLAAWFARC